MSRPTFAPTKVTVQSARNECIGEIDELRLAYHMAQERGGYESLPFDVPKSDFDYMKVYPAQDWAVKMLQ